MRRFVLACCCLLLTQVPPGAPRERGERTYAEVTARGVELAVGHPDGSSGAPIPAELTGNENVRFGFPGGHGRLLVKKYYVIMHEDLLRIPEWVTYHLTGEDLQGTARRSNRFRPDPDIPEGMRAELADYRNSGYDRGHMAPAADFKRNEEAMSETFLLSNMAPQTARLNRGVWERLEEEVRAAAVQFQSIWVVTGTLFLDSSGIAGEPEDFIGPNSVAVPTHFYKVIFCERPDGTYAMFAFIMGNRETSLPDQPRDFIVSVRHIEQLSRLSFFDMLPRAERDSLENLVNTDWPCP